eukprot:scaffold43932_cov69-Phaeocystis_antarctica.AAC.2
MIYDTRTQRNGVFDLTWQLLLVQPLQRQSTDARVEHVEWVHRLPAVTRRLGRGILGAVSVLRRESAAHALDLVLEGHLGIVRVDALREAKASTK